jgi:hypothetical protein
MSLTSFLSFPSICCAPTLCRHSVALRISSDIFLPKGGKPGSSCSAETLPGM